MYGNNQQKKTQEKPQKIYTPTTMVTQLKNLESSKKNIEFFLEKTNLSILLYPLVSSINIY